MAKFASEVPKDILNQLNKLDVQFEEMAGEMCKAGAQAVYNNVVNNMNRVFKTTGSLEKGLKMTRVYKTPSDDGINVHVGFYGYADSDKPVTVRTTKTSKSGKKTTYSYQRSGVPIPLIAMAREYGTSMGEEAKPFMRKSFNKAQIEAEMKRIEAQYIQGD